MGALLYGGCMATSRRVGDRAKHVIGCDFGKQGLARSFDRLGVPRRRTEHPDPERHPPRSDLGTRSTRSAGPCASAAGRICNRR